MGSLLLKEPRATRLPDLIRIREALTAAGRKAYWTRLRAIRGQIGALDRANQKALLTMLQDARKAIIAEIGSARGFSAFYLRELTAEFNRVIDAFGARYGRLMSGATLEHIDLSSRLIFEPLARAGGPTITNFVGLSPDVMEAAATMRGNLITGITADLMRNIDREVRFVALGIKSPWDAMGAIGRNLTDPSVFGSIATRAEIIMRSELGRISSQATMAAMDQIKDVPGVKKRWLWSGISREQHAAIDGQTVDIDDMFTTPDGSQAIAPRLFGDPAHDINCQCDVIVALEDMEPKSEEGS